MDQPPQTFSAYLLRGESIIYRNSTITPKAQASLLQETVVNLDQNVLRTWFLQSIVPLVGQDAANALDGLIDTDTREVTFLDLALQFRQSIT